APLDAPEPPRERPPPTPEELQRERDDYDRTPRGPLELWNMGGFGMYPVALGLLMGLLSGALAFALAFAKSNKGAVIAAGLCLGGGAWAFSTGWLGYVNGVSGVSRAVAHVNPVDRD